MVHFLFKLNLVSFQIYNQNNLEIIFKIMKKYLEIYFKKTRKIMQNSWNFVSLKKWEPCLH